MRVGSKEYFKEQKQPKGYKRQKIILFPFVPWVVLVPKTHFKLISLCLMIFMPAFFISLIASWISVNSIPGPF